MNAKDRAALEAMPLDELIARLRAERPDILAAIEEEGRREREQQQDEQIAQLREQIAYHHGFEAGQQAKVDAQPSIMERLATAARSSNGHTKN